ncbi:MAG: NADAR family protein [Flavobacteriia bacterium]|nr:NADAR family protein [Flavobacteriia bacterium]
MEGIETLALFEEKISLTPRDLANHKINIQSVIAAKLAEKLEGKCSLHGWVLPNSSKVLSRSMGYIEKGRFTGDIVFHIQAQARVLNPPSGSHVVGEVIGNNMMGMYVSYKVRMRQEDRKTKQIVLSDIDAIKIILPRDLHIGDESFSKIEIGDTVHVEIKKSRFQVNDKFILSVGVFGGKADSNYKPPVVEEEENVVVEETGPSKEAAARTAAFQREEAKRDEEERKEADKLRLVFNEDVIPPLEPIAGVTASQVEKPVAQGYRTSGVLQPGIPYASGEPIYFNAAKFEAYKEFDNRFPIQFTVDGVNWPSVEHYYQAMKFPELPEFQEQIRLAPSAATAAKLGKTKDPSKPIRGDWKEKRESILQTALVAKFDQNPALDKMLIDTYPRPLVFADANDAFWGYGRTKMGQNKLGTLLMNLRNSKTGMEGLN